MPTLAQPTASIGTTISMMVIPTTSKEHWHYAGSMLGNRLRRWPNNKPANGQNVGLIPLDLTTP